MDADGTPPGPLTLRSLTIDPPLLNASGAVDLHAADPDWRTDVAALAPLGAYVTKTLTPAPRAGNPQPWVELVGEDTLYNAVGLANPGFDTAIDAWADDLAALDCPVVVSIGGGDDRELCRMAGRLASVPWARAVELNLSCPNIAHGPGRGGMAAGDPQRAAAQVAAVRAATDLPLLAKLSPASDVACVAAAVAGAGADALVATNSMPVRLLGDDGQPLLGSADCGMTGAALHPLALRAVADAATAGIPVVGLGGVGSVAAARRMFASGAAAVAVGSAAAIHPGVLSGLAAWMSVRV